MTYIYIASPYTKGNIDNNVHASLKAAEALIDVDLVPFCPLLYHYWDRWHHREYEYWASLGLKWLRKCDAVLRLPGDSPGAEMEIERAKSLGIDIFYSFNDLITWRKTWK